MAERLLLEPVKQHGHVLWGMLVMLGMLTELALGSLQLAAQEGISVGLRKTIAAGAAYAGDRQTSQPVANTGTIGSAQRALASCQSISAAGLRAG